MATQPKYTSTDIVKENIFLAPEPALSPLYKGCLVTMGGSNLAASEVAENIKTPAGLAEILADSTPISSIAHKFLTPSGLVGVQKTVSAIVSHQVVLTDQDYATGTVTCLKVGHGLPAGETFYAKVKNTVPAAYNGTKKITVVDADTLTYSSEDYGTITSYGTVECASGTATAHGMPANSIVYGHITGLTPSTLNGTYPIAYTDANTFYYPSDYTAATITLVSAKITMAKATVTAHGLSTNKFVPVNVFSTSVLAYNGAKTAVATDANTIYWAVNSTNLAPAFASAKISTVLITATGHGFELDITTGVTISGVLPAIYNGAKSAYIIDANTLAYGGNSSFMGTVTLNGSLLDTQAAELYAMGASFFAQNSGLPVAVLELGNVSVATAIQTFADFLAINEDRFHAYALPVGFDVPDFKSVALTYAPINKFPIFFMPTSLAGVAEFLNSGLYDLEATLESNSASRSNSENVPAAKMVVYLNRRPSETAPMGQCQWQYVNGLTPYEFANSKDPLQLDYKNANLTYVVDCAEGGIAENAFINSYLMASNVITGKRIDSIAKWAINYVKLEFDRTFAAAIFASANDATKRLKLNNQDGRQTFKTLKTIGQGEIDRFVREGVIDQFNDNGNGTSSKVTFEMMDYFEWANSYPQELADSNIQSAASVTISIAARGITNLTLNIAVKFA